MNRENTELDLQYKRKDSKVYSEDVYAVSCINPYIEENIIWGKQL